MVLTKSFKPLCHGSFTQVRAAAHHDAGRFPSSVGVDDFNSLPARTCHSPIQIHSGAKKNSQLNTLQQYFSVPIFWSIGYNIQ